MEVYGLLNLSRYLQISRRKCQNVLFERRILRMFMPFSGYMKVTVRSFIIDEARTVPILETILI